MSVIATMRVRPAWVDARSLEPIARARAILKKEYSLLDFDPAPHVYTDRETGFVPACVSDVVETWCTFDAPRKAAEIEARDCNRKGSKYYGMKAADILAAWQEKSDRATSKGTVLHSFAEACFCVATGRPEDVEKEWTHRVSDDGKFISALSNEETGIMQAFAWMPDWLVPVVKECRLYNHRLGYAGTLDLLCYDRKCGLPVLLDWKTNETLDKGHFNRMKAPFGHLWDISLSHYKIQQSLYQIRLEDLGFRLAGRWLLHIDSVGIFTPVAIESYADVLRRELAARKAAGLTADGKPISE